VFQLFVLVDVVETVLKKTKGLTLLALNQVRNPQIVFQLNLLFEVLCVEDQFLEQLDQQRVLFVFEQMQNDEPFLERWVNF
jgi:hypothetical protein